MNLNKKRAPRTGNTDIDRIITDLYTDLNEIIDAVNSSAKPEMASYAGKSGDIRLIKTGRKSYSIEGKFGEGWASVNMVLKEK
jgi:hypothetical protein